MKVVVEGINDENCQRASQLLNKTNQMNLTTRRMTEVELVDWGNEKNHRIWTFRVIDKLGDSGLTGLASVEWDKEEIRVTDFLLSCRVMGRKVEEIMLHVATEYGRSLNLKTLTASYLTTKKNHPCYIFLKQSGFEHDEKTDTFMWSLENPYPRPDYIKIVSQNSLNK
jgi:FkbH-like protein